MKKDKFVLVTEHPVKKYKCGLQAGDLVRLRQDIIVRDHKGKPTGTIHSAGEVWKVLPGSKVGRIDVWFMQPDGGRHTWADERTAIDEWFEKVNK